MKTKIILIGLAAVLAVGCVSRGLLTGELDKYHAIYFSDLNPFDEAYAKEVSQRLALYGLETTSATNRADALRCKLVIDQQNVWGFSVQLALWDNDKVLVAGGARNPGFGNLLAPDASIHNLFESALSQLESQLRKGGLHRSSK
jgi:hypothetical protein